MKKQQENQVVYKICMKVGEVRHLYGEFETEKDAFRWLINKFNFRLARMKEMFEIVPVKNPSGS